MKALKDSSITKFGVFDSGVGGLTVLKELLNTRPGHDYVYFGDTAHVPYGDRKADDVVSLVVDIGCYLVAEGCQGLILACNTSSALAISALRATVDVPLVGVIETAAREAAKQSKGTVVVLANPLTAASGVYKKEIMAQAKLLGKEFLLKVEEVGCPDLVPIVENGELHTEHAREVLQGYADRIAQTGADTLVLGCTHYPLLLPVLQPLLRDTTHIVNPADLMPTYLHPAGGEGKVEYKVSGDPTSFEKSASEIIGMEITAQQVVLNKETV